MHTKYKQFVIICPFIQHRLAISPFPVLASPVFLPVCPPWVVPISRASAMLGKYTKMFINCLRQVKLGIFCDFEGTQGILQNGGLILAFFLYLQTAFILKNALYLYVVFIGMHFIDQRFGKTCDHRDIYKMHRPGIHCYFSLSFEKRAFYKCLLKVFQISFECLKLLGSHKKHQDLLLLVFFL